MSRHVSLQKWSLVLWIILIWDTKWYAGWWYTYPSEKYESQLGWLFPIYGKKMFQTTNQYNSLEYESNSVINTTSPSNSYSIISKLWVSQQFGYMPLCYHGLSLKFSIHICISLTKGKIRWQHWLKSCNGGWNVTVELSMVCCCLKAICI
jgi:hypothetical protein